FTALRSMAKLLPMMGPLRLRKGNNQAMTAGSMLTNRSSRLLLVVQTTFICFPAKSILSQSNPEASPGLNPAYMPQTNHHFSDGSIVPPHERLLVQAVAITLSVSSSQGAGNEGCWMSWHDTSRLGGIGRGTGYLPNAYQICSQ